MRKWSDMFEGIGLSLILFSFFVQMVEIGIEDDIQEMKTYQIHQKLDYIWAITSNDYAMRYPERDVHFAIDFKYYNDSYKIYSEDHNELSNWQKLVGYSWFKNIRLSLFIIGSIILIFPKFYKGKEGTA